MVVLVILLLMIVLVVNCIKLSIYFDGGYKGLNNLAGGGVIGIIGNREIDFNREVFRCQYCYHLEEHYNSHISEYITLINAIQLTKYYMYKHKYDINEIQINSDSEILVDHITNRYNRKRDFFLHQYHNQAISLLDSITDTKVDLVHIPRANNTIADELANNAMSSLTSLSTVPSLYQGSLFILQLNVNQLNEQFISIYNTIDIDINIGNHTTTINTNDYDKLRVIDIINNINDPSISINSNDINIDIPILKTLEKYDTIGHDDVGDGLETLIEIPVQIVSKYFGTVPPMTLSLLYIPFTQKDYILKAIISYINSSPSSSSSSSSSNFTYIFTSLIHSLQRRGLQSILNNKLLVKAKGRKCIPITTTILSHDTTTMLSDDDTSRYYYATPLQVSLLVGNIKTTKLLLSLGGLSVIYNNKNDDNDNIINNLSDDDAVRIGGNIKNKKLINDFMKTIK